MSTDFSTTFSTGFSASVSFPLLGEVLQLSEDAKPVSNFESPTDSTDDESEVENPGTDQGVPEN
jgi:hypothetical protein